VSPSSLRARPLPAPLRARPLPALRRKLVAGVGTVAVTAGVLFAPPAAAAPTAAPQAPGSTARTSAGWLTEQFTPGTHLQSSVSGSYYDDQGLTADGILALDAAKVGQSSAATATTWLAANLAPYVGDGKAESYAGSLAKTALVAQAQGANPSSFGGRDLLTALEARQVAAAGTDPGRFSDKSQFGDFSNAITQSFAVLTLVRANRQKTLPAAITSLRSLQCSDGGFRLGYPTNPTNPCVSDPDATAFAVQALVRQPGTERALDYLVKKQGADGGVVSALGPENANTTGLAAVAFALGGRQTAVTKAYAYLKARQAEAAGTPTGVGAVNFKAGGYDPDTALRSTTQALLGLAVGDDPTRSPTAAAYATVSRTGAAAEAPTTAVPRGSFAAITPVRSLDTRTRNVAVPAGKTVDVTVAGVSGVPATVSAVGVNITAVTPAGPGYVVAYPTGGPVPATSNLNLIAGATVAAGAQVAVGTAGRITLANRSLKPLNLLLDVNGYYRPGAGLAAGAFRTVAPTRLLDTRTTKTSVPAGKSVDLQVLGSDPVPVADVAAVAVTVTAVSARTPGFVTAYPTGATRSSSTLNLIPGQTVANGAVVKLGTGGKITLVNGSTTPLDLLVDVTGLYLAGTARFPGTFTALTPARVLDTRTGGGPLTPGPARTVPVAGRAGVPASGAAAVLYNLTAVAPAASGYLVATPSGQQPTGTSTVNLVPRVTVANLASTRLGSNGALALTVGSTRPVDVIVDVSGWFRP